ncbi:cAMP-dependent protein kinase regulatory subunit [Hondaea fermentalgiana]|uniref:cAMP-dependent protein kinase regulatory subunit n=1 Tax=Hondaea fermentalgiana TaxID=2315210 RepID=A0A2R5G820_9STRA|nr:cAMP-dependent protein kinase regulatory subunit [Hondaea fermentalgiana]|eukprot:GBG27206.1 cAMP-dependent protein kinase regulatory subunit [Hondaea fermentalgiana]
MGCVESSPARAVTEISNVGTRGQQIAQYEGNPEAFAHQSAKSQTGSDAHSSRRGTFSPDDHKDALVAFMMRSPLFAGKQSNRKLSYAVSGPAMNLQVDVVPRGVAIYTQGDPANEIAIIMSGSVSRHAEGEQPGKLGPDEIAGAVEFKHKIWYAASYVTEEETCIIRISQHMMEPSPGARTPSSLVGVQKHITEKGNIWITKVLGSVDLFSKRISKERLAKAAEAFRVRRVGAYERVYTLGENANAWYVLANGKAVATMSNDSDETAFSVTELKNITPGQGFGECALISKSKSPKRPITVSTLSDVVLLEITKQAFDKLISTAPDLRQEIIDAMRARTLLTGSSDASKFTRFLSPTKIEMLASMAAPVTFNPHQDVVSEGTVHHKTFYLIAEGVARVLKGIDETPVRELTPGEYFGELSLVTGRPHSATVRAGPKGLVCLAVNEDDFSRVFLDEPTVYAELRLRVLGAECNLRDILYQQDCRQAFMRHCEKEVAQENVQFYFAVEELEARGQHRIRKGVLKSLGYDIEAVIQSRFNHLVKTSHEIYDKFVDADAEMCVNLEDNHRRDLEAQFAAEEYSYEMFTPAKDAIYKLMAGDNFMRFETSQGLADVLRQIGPYDPEEEGRPRSMARKIQSIASRRERKRERKEFMAKQRTANRFDHSLIRAQIEE